jgi:pimeloyl-ACP methyl ester carboxylesterase
MGSADGSAQSGRRNFATPVLRLYRASKPENFTSWESAFLALTKSKPTLVIWGDNDPYISARFNANKVVILPVGHWAPVEAPAECAEAILQFFASHPG